MNPHETTKRGAEGAGTPVESSSPSGHEEIERQAAADALGEAAVTEPSPAASRKNRKKLAPDQKLNPRRTKNSHQN